MDADVKEVLESTWVEITSKKILKSKLLEFLYEVQEYCSENDYLPDNLEVTEESEDIF